MQQRRRIAQRRTVKSVRNIRSDASAQRPKEPGLFWHISVLVVALFAVIYLARAQTFGLPPGPPPDNTGLNGSPSSSDFVDLNAGSRQTIAGSLVVASSTQSRAILGDYPNNASVTGIAGLSSTSQHPSLSTYGASGTGVYGYSTASTRSAYGVAGYGTGSGTGIYAAVGTSGGAAANFFGPLVITGAVTVQNELHVPMLIATGDTIAGYAINSDKGIALSGTLENGVYGATTVSGPDESYGIYGYSDTTYGVSSVNSISAAPSATFYGAQGYTQSTTNNAGVFGYVAKGNGVVAAVGAVSDMYAAEGKVTGASRGGTDYSKAVYGYGGAYSGYFEGDVMISATSELYIGSKGLTEQGLRDLLEWCGATCPDPYQ